MGSQNPLSPALARSLFNHAAPSSKEQNSGIGRSGEIGDAKAAKEEPAIDHEKRVRDENHKLHKEKMKKKHKTKELRQVHKGEKLSALNHHFAKQLSKSKEERKAEKRARRKVKEQLKLLAAKEGTIKSVEVDDCKGQDKIEAAPKYDMPEDKGYEAVLSDNEDESSHIGATIPENMREALLRTIQKSSRNGNVNTTPNSSVTNTPTKIHNKNDLLQTKHSASDGKWQKRGGLPAVQLFSSGIERSPAPSPEPSPGKSTVRPFLLFGGSTIPGNNGNIQRGETKSIRPSFSTPLMKHNRPANDKMISQNTTSQILPTSIPAVPKLEEKVQPRIESSLNSNHKRPHLLANDVRSSPKTPTKRQRSGEPIDPPIIDSSPPTRANDVTHTKLRNWEINGGRIKATCNPAQGDGNLDGEESIAFSSKYITKCSDRSEPIVIGNIKFSTAKIIPGAKMGVSDEVSKSDLVVISVAKGRVSVVLGGVKFDIGEGGMWRVRSGEVCKVRNKLSEDAVLHVTESS